MNETETIVPANRSGLALYLLLGAAAAMLTLVAALNYRVDPLGLFDDGRLAEKAARHLMAGRAIAGNNLDDRPMHAAYARLAQQPPETLVLGSSRMMSVTADMVGGHVYNAAVSSATLPDLLALTQVFLAAGKRPRRMIIGLDTWLLDARPRNERWRALADAYAAMLARLGLPNDDTASANPWQRRKMLVSLSYLRETTAVLWADWRQSLLERTGSVRVIPAGKTDLAARRPDGSLRYAAHFGNRAPARVRADAVRDGRNLIAEALRGTQFDSATAERFQRFVSYLRGQGVSVVFLLTPYHPAAVATVMARDDGFLQMQEARYRVMAEWLEIPVIGSYLPDRAGCPAAEFFDGNHAKPGCLTRLLVKLDGNGRQ